MRVRVAAGLMLAVGLVAASPSEADAQDPPPAQQPPPDVELVFEREIFQYPAFTRRNPFRPLEGGGEGGGPLYNQLTLIGIMYSDDPTQSVAVLSTGGVSIAEDGSTAPIEGDAYYLRVGDTLGNVTIREIRRDEVDVIEREFDEQIPRTMVFVSRRPGGTP